MVFRPLWKIPNVHNSCYEATSLMRVLVQYTPGPEDKRYCLSAKGYPVTIASALGECLNSESKSNIMTLFSFYSDSDIGLEGLPRK